MIKYSIYSFLTPDGLCYVGASRNVPRRMREHAAKLGFKPTPTILETCGDDWRDREHHWIEQYRLRQLPMANRTAGRNGCEGHSDATRRVLSEKLRGRMPSEATLKAARAARTGSVHSEETRRKMSEAAKGRPANMIGVQRSAEARRGKARDPDIGKRISEAKRGKSFSDAHRAALAEAKRGTKRGPQSEETKAKISAKRLAYWARVKAAAT